MNSLMWICGIATAFSLNSCNGQTSRYAEGKRLAMQQQALQAALAQPPGLIPTTSGGYTMTARLNGKPWTAKSMKSPEASTDIIGFTSETEYIVFGYDRRYLQVGNVIEFKEGHSSHISLDDAFGYRSAKNGQMKINKIGDKWVEGTFSFVANSEKPGSTIKVTDGFFRIPNPKSK